MAQPENQLTKLISRLASTSNHELDCDTCDQQLDTVIDLIASGEADVGKLLPLVEQHLNTCGDCHEEYEALLIVLRAEKTMD